MIRTGYDGKQFQLVNKQTRLAVDRGAIVTDFRGDQAELVTGRAPHKPSSSGHVTTRRDGVEYDGESYAGVYGLEWVELKA